MTKTKALATIKARITPRGVIRWLSPSRPDALDLIATLGYWPQLRRRGRKPLNQHEARRFLTSLGYIEVQVPREYVLEGPGTLGWSHPNGDEAGAQIALDILEGRMDVTVQLHRAADDARRVKRESHAIKPRSGR